MSDSLAARVAAALARDVDPAVRAFASLLAGEAGAMAVLFYGSNLRTGSLEGVLDFYVLLPGGEEGGIWPRVSYRELSHGGQVLRAKIASMTLSTFARAAAGDLLDTTIWTRFVQPAALVWQREAEAGAQVHQAVEAAAITAARLAAALGPERGSEAEYWRALFRATYRAELRVEKPGREDSILALNPAHFDGLFQAALKAGGIGVASKAGIAGPALTEVERRQILRWWRRRRRAGRPLNAVRLVKASATFDGAARYAAWKIHRHTGIEIAVTPWRERHPVLAAPGVLWQLWRRRR